MTTTTEKAPLLELEQVVRRVYEISSLPHIAIKVIEVSKDPDAGAKELKLVLESDPSLSARVLRVVNSAAYGVANHVTSLQQAISYLGFNQIRNLAMTASVAEIFKNAEQIGEYSREGLWRHLVSTGIVARQVAIRCTLSNFEDAFLAGLLHDIGIVLLDQHAHAQFSRCMQELDPSRSLIHNEMQFIGVDHALLGGAIARAWKFPAELIAAIQHHHDPESYNGDRLEIVQCVAVANLLCTLKGRSSVGHRLIKPPIATLKALGLTKDDVVILADDLDNLLAKNRGLFEL